MSYYDMIKEMAKSQKCRVTDLIALAPQNDPFYAGTPSDRALGEWFADLWRQFGYRSNVHIRRVHYQIISQDPPIQLPDGTTYENTERCWDVLNQASKMARYLELVDAAAFADRRNPDPHIYTRYRPEPPAVSVYDSGWQAELPDFPEPPRYYIDSYEADQPFAIEIFAEKSTMNDVLIPICQRYGCNLVTGLGELSITATLALVRRLEESGKPTRILYISDFDPAGQSMPVAVARKLEYFIRNQRLDADVRLFPIVLSAEQVRHYQLPRTPIKETERRAARFEERFGSGAVELDALEAIHPGELRRLLSAYIENYFDPTLYQRQGEARDRLDSGLYRARWRVLDRHQTAIEKLRAEYDAIRRDFEQRLGSYQERQAELWQAISGDLATEQPDLEDYPLPEARPADEINSGLYNSERDYTEQIIAYKAFQGK